MKRQKCHETSLSNEEVNKTFLHRIIVFKENENQTYTIYVLST